MKNHLRVIFLFILLSFLGTNSVNAQNSEVVSTIWYDHDHLLWVKVTNQSQNEIRIQRIAIEFRNSKATEQMQIRCQENCGMVAEATKDFGPLSLPKKSSDVKVNDIKFTILNQGSSPNTMNNLNDLATRYAKAWSGQNPDAFAEFYSESGSLRVNDGPVSTGRKEISDKARSFMTAFPDMVVSLDKLVLTPKGAEFHWIWTGTNTGPGGTGKKVRMKGYEDWTIGTDGLILESKGHYDEAEYERQVTHGVE
jgi:hypothetical protein